MNEFEELLNSVSEVNTGDVVTAEVISVDNDQANVVIEGTGIEGVLTRRELTNDRDANVADLVKVGETLEVLVLRQPLLYAQKKTVRYSRPPPVYLSGKISACLGICVIPIPKCFYISFLLINKPS